MKININIKGKEFEVEAESINVVYGEYMSTTTLKMDKSESKKLFMDLDHTNIPDGLFVEFKDSGIEFIMEK